MEGGPGATDWIRAQRNVENWAAVGLGRDAWISWRRCGFSFDEAADWFNWLSDYDAVDGVEPTDWPVLASAWVVAGFEVCAAQDWDDALPHVKPREKPMLAREWVEAGFSAKSASVWADRESVFSATALENAGWHPRERDLGLLHG